MNQLPKKSIALEDLLRVKRAEHPPMEFWADFDRDLRAKQLAAIVEPRPWWAPFIRVGSRVARYQMPVGAAAVLALSFVTVREYRSDNETSVLIAPPAYSISAPTAVTPENVGPDRQASALAPAPVAAERSVPSAVAESEVAATGLSSHSVQLTTDTPAVATEPTPSARYIAANLAAAQADNPNVVNQAFGQIVRSLDLREPIRDPLAQIGTSRETRRSRLLASALAVSAGPSDMVDVPSGARATRRLTEERLYDTISRIGLQGDRVAIKF